jgi:hypothetical protein
LYVTDIDECNELNVTCADGAVCVNTQGSYQCTCKGGYEEVNGECTGMSYLSNNLGKTARGRGCTAAAFHGDNG